MVPGTEYSGVVAGAGANAKRAWLGQKVAGERAVGCGLCEPCTTGDFHGCEGKGGVALLGTHGAYAEYIVVPSSYVRKLPLYMPLRQGALIGTLAACVESLRKLSTRPGESACVMGAGPVGNLCSQVLGAWGVSVTTVDPDPRWLSLLYKHEIDTLGRLNDIQDFDVLVEASGDGQMLKQLADGASPRARIVYLGPPFTNFSANGTAQAFGDRRVFGGFPARHPKSWTEAINLVQSGAVNLVDHTSSVEPLEAFLGAWDMVETGERFKVLLGVAGDLEAL